MRRVLVAAIAFLGVAALPHTAKAALITGELDFAGGVVVNATSADWFLSVTPTPSGPNEAVIIGSSVADGGVPVAPLSPGNLLFETNLTAATPAGVPLNVDLFEHAINPAAPVVDYVLNFVDTCAQLNGPYICLGNSPFGFIQNSNSVTIALQMSGTVFDEATPGVKNTWTGSWSTQVAGAILCHANGSLVPPCDANSIFGIIESGGSIANSYSGTKITASGVPEPATLLTFGFGSLALARYRRRKKAA